ncbi:MAG TPA: 50S ribosomal protein L9 [Actinomycetaceae bacterium]|nr:50S ribosomal protein L9 [Actinomycetaceae bacterium]
MKLILTAEVPGLGSSGDVVEVKDGYARNYLLPRGFATRWTKGAERQIEQMQAARQAREIASIEDARAVRDEIEDAPIVVRVKAGDTGRLFGAVSGAQIAESLLEKGVKVDRRRVSIPAPIKTVGDYKVAIRLHEDVMANADVQVRPGK